jgi:hypothetical protein
VPFQQDGVDKYLLLTAMLAAGGVHNPVGGAVFSRVGDRWQVDVAQVEIGDLREGLRVHLDGVEPVQIGPDEYGMFVYRTDVDLGGDLYKSIQLVVQQGDWLDTIASIEMGLSSNYGFGYYTSTLEFVPGGTPQFYDIRVMAIGKSAVGCSFRPILPFERITIYTFSEAEQRYVLLSNETNDLIEVTQVPCSPG